MKLWESRHCRFGAPDSWVYCPPFGLSEPGDDEDRLNAQVLERWMERPTTAADWARNELAVLPILLQEFDLEAERSLDVPSGSGHALTFRFRNDDGDNACERRVYLTQGPLLCELTISAVERPPDQRNPLFDGITATFALQGTEHLARVEPLPALLRPLEPPPEGSRLPGRQSFPTCCVSIPVPDGWASSGEGVTARLQIDDAEIVVERQLLSDGDLDLWYSARMEALKEAGSELIRTERGELPEGQPYTAIAYDAGSAQRSWKTSAVKRRLELFVDHHQPLQWSLEAHDSRFPVHQPVFEAVIAQTTFLDPSEWQTPLPQPWLDVVLKGPWRPAGGGAFLCVDDPTFTYLYLSVLPCTTAVRKLGPSLADSLRKGVDQVLKEEELAAEWHGLDSFRYSVDGRDDEGKPVSQRGLWFMAREILYTVVVAGNVRSEVDKVLAQLMDGVRVTR